MTRKRNTTAPKADKSDAASAFSRHPLISIICTAIFTASGTLIVSDFVDFSKSDRELLATEFKEIKANSDALREALRPFALVAIGRGPKDERKLSDLKVTIGRAVTTADSIFQHEFISEAVYHQYKTSLVALQANAIKLNSPLDAKPFVSAVDDYADADMRLANELAKRQNSWHLFGLGLRASQTY